jgi:hypothetical protein
MAREILVTRDLSKDMIIAGKKLIKRIKNDIDLKAVYWDYVSDTEEWRLVLVSEDFRKYGAKKIFEQVFKANETAKEQEKVLSMFNIFVSSGSEELDRLIENQPSKTETHTNDMYIYSKDYVKSDESHLYNQNITK